MKVWQLTWAYFPGRIEARPGRCPSCRKVAAAIPTPAPAAGDLTACPACLAPLRFDAATVMHKIRESGITRIVYDDALTAVELLNLIEQYSQAQRQPAAIPTVERA